MRLAPRDSSLAHRPSMQWLGLALVAGCSTTSPAWTFTSPGASSEGGAGTMLDDGGSSSGSATSSSSGSGGDDASTGALEASTGEQDAGTDGRSGGGEVEASSPPGPKAALIWLWNDYANSLNDIVSHAKSFTHVSPAFYQVNYGYSTGAARSNGSNYSGLSIQQIVQKIHDAGMKCVPLVQAGAGNSGTDQGIQNILNDSPAGAQNSFITSMAMEAQANKYDGYNLDWEVGNSGTGYAAYGMKLTAFLTAFKKALNAQGMTLSIDIGDWYTLQCGSDGLVDLTQMGPAVDQVILMDYAGSLGNPQASCPASPPAQPNCAGGNQFGALLNVMCEVVPSSAVNIGLIAGNNGGGTNPIADKALNAVSAIGFRSVAVWPSPNSFLDSSNVPGGATWYSLLEKFLAP